THCTIVALAESPLRPGLLYAGTDDGNVWLTRNDGGAWENLTGRFPGVPAGTYVSRIEPSHFDTATFYVTFDGHRTNDFAPYVYVTTDFGKTFAAITHTLPTGGPDYVHVVREDPFNRNLLYVGTDVGAYISRDRGTSWQKFTTGDRRTQTKVVISDVRGDTVRTVNGPGGPGLHRVAWGFQGRLPSPQPLSPSQRRDSTLIARRIQVVFDSLEKAGTNAQMLGP